jgi:hypothetical protein
MDDLVGRIFGRLRVIAFDHMDKNSNSYWLCECECGNQSIVRRGHLLSGDTVSCGCNLVDFNKKTHTAHGMSNKHMYRSWYSMKHRCNNPNAANYGGYGGRGITVCDEWNDFNNFYNWSMSHGYKPGLSIDRINNNDGYDPGNCRWATSSEQANNKRDTIFVTYNGQTHSVAEWARLFNVVYSTLNRRIKRGVMQDFEEYFGVIDPNYSIHSNL